MTAKLLTFISCLLTPGLLIAQTGQAPAPRPPLNQSQRMYEDIEIMRRIINRKLAAWPSLIALNQRCTDCHAAPQATLFKNLGEGKFVDVTQKAGLAGDLGNDDIFLTNNNAIRGQGVALGDFNNDGLVDILLLNNPHQGDLRNPHVLLSIPWNTEGVYLKGQGVVYTVTLPPPRVAWPQDKKAPAKPVSDWERIRRQVHGDKEQERDSVANEASQVGDWIHQHLGDGGHRWVTETFLKLMAENGQHFSQLPENEKLTLVVTFRDTGQLKGTANVLQGTQNNGLEAWGAQREDEAQSWNVNQPDPGLQSWQNQQPALKLGTGSEGGVDGGGSSAGPGGKGAPSSFRDFELLGDLHLRQSKAREAIKTYQQALNLNPPPKEAARIYYKIAQADLMLEDDAAARKALDMVQDLKERQGAAAQNTAKPQAANRQTASASPVSKLIISAPKRLLDLVGTGKLGFHDFEKQVTIETVGFSTPQNQENKSTSTKQKG